MREASEHRGERIWTPTELLEWSAGYFAGKGVPNPRYDAERLLAHVLGCTRIDLYLRFDQPLAPDELARYRELVRHRAAREPVAYLTGETGFWNLSLEIRPGCLVPRPETETLVEATVEAVAALREADAAWRESDGPQREASSTAPLWVAEWGAGSGAIALAVLSETRGLCWVATERSPQALAVAAANRRRHAELVSEGGHRLWLVAGDGFAGLAPGFRPALIVSNPPYIPTGEIDRLEPEVARHEPREALDGGPDGLAAHRLLAAEAAQRLPPGGRLLLEIGHDQGEAIGQVIGAHPPLRLLELRDDLGGRPRVAIAERGDDVAAAG